MINPLLSRFATEPSLVSEQHGEQVNSFLRAAENDPRMAELKERSVNGYKASKDDDDEPLDDDENFWPKADSWMARFRPYNVKDGILVIPVKGVLLANFPYTFFGYVTGYEYIWKAYDRGMSDGAVRGIAFDIDSPGGMVQGNFDLVDRMYALRDQKPVRSFANENAYSAAFSIATVGDKIIVGRTGGVGSIGVVTAHVDYSEMMKKEGIKVTFIKKGAHKTDGNPYEPLPKSVEARIQKRIDALGEIFIAIVARNRDMDAKAVRDTEALTYSADEAIKVELADEIGPMDTALAAFAAETKPKENGVFHMTTETNKSAAPAATTQPDNDAINAARKDGEDKGKAAGAQAAKDRIKAIMGLDEAKTRPIAANSVAMETELTVEQAKVFLAKMPDESKPAATGKTPFEKAMEKDNPELGEGTDPEKGDQGKSDDKVASILAAQSALRGAPRKAKAA